MSNGSREARKRMSSFAPLGLVLGIAGASGLVSSGLGYRLGWWQLVTALTIGEWAAYAAALGLTLSLLGAILARPGSGRRGFLASLLGVAASLPVVVAAVHWQYAARVYPPINDISTDTEDPPIFWNMPNPTEFAGGKTAGLQRAAYPDLAPVVLNIAPERAYALALAVVREKGWQVVADEAADGRIEAVERSLLYGFSDEVVIRITAAGANARVDLRSRSRIGRIDRGVNARRIRAFFVSLKQRARP